MAQKNNAGGIDAFKLDVKNVTVTAVKDSMQCYVRILDTYLSHLPKDIPLNTYVHWNTLEAMCGIAISLLASTKFREWSRLCFKRHK